MASRTSVVNAPVPGPSSRIHFASVILAALTMHRASAREEGTTAPVIFQLARNSRKKTHDIRHSNDVETAGESFCCLLKWRAHINDLSIRESGLFPASTPCSQ